MNAFLTYKKTLSTILSVFLLVIGVQSGLVNAAMVSTESQLEVATVNYDRAQLQTALQSFEAQEWLLSMGVSPDDVEQRIANMTPEELAEFNSELESMPAGASSALGVIAVIFLILIVLDLLGTTNVFPVIKPINQY